MRRGEVNDADETVRAYLLQLAALGRKPVVAEYDAAKAWIEGRGARMSEQGKIEQARDAGGNGRGDVAIHGEFIMKFETRTAPQSTCSDSGHAFAGIRSAARFGGRQG